MGRARLSRGLSAEDRLLHPCLGMARPRASRLRRWGRWSHRRGRSSIDADLTMSFRSFARLRDLRQLHPSATSESSLLQKYHPFALQKGSTLCR